MSGGNSAVQGNKIRWSIQATRIRVKHTEERRKYPPVAIGQPRGYVDQPTEPTSHIKHYKGGQAGVGVRYSTNMLY